MLRLLPLLLAAGCAANLSTLEGPRTLEPGQILVDGEAGVGIPVGTVSRALDAATALGVASEEAAASGEPLDPAAIREVFAAGTALALSPPGTVTGLGLRVGLPRNFEVGARISSTDLRLGAKWMFAGDGESTAANAVALSVLRRRFRGPLADAYDKLQSATEIIPGLGLEDPKRTDLELLYLRGKKARPWLEPYAAARYRLGFYHVPAILSVDIGGQQAVESLDLDGTSHLFGLSGGLAVGKDPIWLRLELNGAYSYARTEVLDAPVNFGGLTFFPAASLSLQTRPPKHRP